jgi:hypothetical protein
VAARRRLLLGRCGDYIHRYPTLVLRVSGVLKDVDEPSSELLHLVSAKLRPRRHHQTGFAPAVPHFANLPLAALHRIVLAGALGRHLVKHSL